MEQLKICPFCGAQVNLDKEKEIYGWEKFACFFNFLEETGPEITGELLKIFVKSWSPQSGVWIPVYEKMPEDGERVLVFHDDYVVRIGMAENGEFRPVINRMFKNTPVTHWKPLPPGPIALQTL